MATNDPSKYTSKLRDARVLIIGGTSGIGFGIAEACIEHRASVIVSSSSQQRIDTAIQRLESTCTAAHGRVKEVEKLFNKASKDGKLDHVIHTASDTMAIGALEDFAFEQIRQAGMVRFFSPLVVAQQLRKHVKSTSASSYTLTTGGLSERPRMGWVVVMSYLTGLEGMSRALARELAPLRVNLVSPGPVTTELWQAHGESPDMEGFKADLAKSLVTGKFADVEDVVEAYLYVMKDKNITGSIILTNGGGLLT